MKANLRSVRPTAAHRSRRCPRTLLALGLATVVLSGGAERVGPACAQTEGEDPGVLLPASVEGELRLPDSGQVVGFAWMGPDTLAVLLSLSDLRTASGESQTRLVIQGRSGNVWRQDDFSGVLTRALAWDGTFLWSCGDADDGGSVLYKIGFGAQGGWQVQEAYDTPGHRPSDLCFDGRFIWLSDRDSGRVDRFDPEVEEITRSALAPGFSPVGLAWDGSNMWLCDSGTGLLYRLSGSRRTWSATVDPAVFLHRGQEVLLAGAGGTLWFLEPGGHLIRQIRFR